MGRGHTASDIFTELAGKDEHISNLKLQIEAYVARNSHTQSRLLSTLDTLDQLQASHARELAELTRTKDKLSEKLDRYIDIVSAAEDEKDDMKDAVNHLVEKDPITRPRLDEGLEAGNNFDEQMRIYCASIIASLRMERDAERRAHEETRRDAEDRIAMLEAQVARRDAELEACVAHHDHRIHDAPHRIRRRPTRQTNEPGQRMTEEEAITVLQMASVKNRSLEMEVKSLAERLEKARANAASIPPAAQDGRIRRDAAAATDRGSTTAIAPPSSDPPLPSPTSLPNAQKLSSHVPEAFVALSSRIAGPSRDHSDPAHVPSSPYLRSPLHGVPCRHPDENRNHPPDDHDQAAPFLSRPIRELDYLIENLASSVDAFKAERGILHQVIEEQGVEPEIGHGEDDFDRILLIEEECIRLTRSEQALRECFKTFKHAAETRERNLRDEIERLLDNDHKARPIPGHPDSDAGEQSMELATPLPATLLLPAFPPSAEQSDRPAIDPQSAPLPPSPILRVSSAPIPRCLPTTSPVRPGFSNIERIGNELALARREIDAREGVIAQLRYTVRDLQRQLIGEGGNADVIDMH